MGVGGLGVVEAGMGCRRVCRREGGVDMGLGGMGMEVGGRGRGWTDGWELRGV